MKVAIMQPYLFPYIGYFQLIRAADVFVIYDDVQYIKGGWINRNRILLNKRDHMFTFSLKKASSFHRINERYFSGGFFHKRSKFIQTLNENYGKAENYEEVSFLVEKILNVDVVQDNIATIITKSLKEICNYLNIQTTIVLSSKLENNNQLVGESRVIDINKQLNALHYINPIGGRELYCKDRFQEHGLQLSFLQSRLVPYKQQSDEFVPWLSIIDVLMCNSKATVQKMMDEYDLQ